MRGEREAFHVRELRSVSVFVENERGKENGYGESVCLCVLIF